MARPRYNPASLGMRFDTSGRVYVPAKGGRQYLETAAPTVAVHSNPGFEDETAGYPDVWDFFWGTGTETISSEATVTYSGERSAKVHLAAGGGDQVVMSDAFDVFGRGNVEFSVFACKDEGDPVIQLGLITRSGADPVFFDGVSEYYETPARSLETSWERYDYRVRVPRGHTRARLFFRITPDASEAVTAYLDMSESSSLAATAPMGTQSGGLNVTYAGATQQQTAAVTYPEEFAAAPHVVLTAADPRFTVAVSSVTTTGFTVTAYYIPGAALAGFVLPVHWVAHVPE